MAKTGLYVLQEVQEAGNVSWERNVLYKDGTELNKTSTRPNKLGTYVIGDTVYIDGESIAKNQNASITERDKFDIDGKPRSSNITFGEIDFDRPQTTELGEKCINIILANYNKLYKGELVEGYRAFDPHAVYNIVPNVNTARTVYYNNVDNREELIYNNVAPAGSTYDLSDSAHVLNDNTFLEPWRTPCVSVHDVPYRIKPDENLSFMVMVDTFDCAKIERDEIGDTFKIIVKNSNDDIIYSNVVYAGQHWLNISNPFSYIDSILNPKAGVEAWFSVECIDNHGHGSAVQYFNILFIDDDRQLDIYQVTAEDLQTFEVVTDNNNQIVAYKNKKALSDLFAYYATEGYDGIKMPEDIKIYVDYHKRIGGTEENPTFGEQTYYVATDATVEKEYVTEWPTEEEEAQGIEPTRQTFRLANSRTLVEIGTGEYQLNTGETALDYIKRDGANICRVEQSDLDKENVPWTDNPVGKTWVKWQSPNTDMFGIYDSSIQQFIGINNLNSDTDKDIPFRFLRTYPLSWFNNTSEETVYDEDSETPETPITITVCNNRFPTCRDKAYIVENTAECGDDIIFPDNFIIDFNGASLEVLPSYDLNTGTIINLIQNINVQIKNLTLIGCFTETYDFLAAYLNLGMRNLGATAEHCKNTYTGTSKYCVYDNVESIQALCYDGCVGGVDSTGSRYEDEGSIVKTYGRYHYNVSARYTKRYFTNQGYVDYAGELISNCPAINAVKKSSAGTSMHPLDNDGIQWEINNGNGSRIGLAHEPTKFKCKNVGIVYPVNDNNISKDWITNDLMCNGVVYGYQNGKYHEYFIHFYDDNDNFIKTIKSRLYYIVKVPTNAAYYTLSIYGMCDTNGAPKTKSKTSGSNTYVYNAALTSYQENLQVTIFTGSQGITFKNCSWKNTRSIAFEPAVARGSTWESCTFENIAYLPRKDWFITKDLADFEDGSQACDLVTIKNCVVNTDTEPPFNKEGFAPEDTIWLIHARNFTFINNNMFSISERGGLLNGYIANNQFRSYGISRGVPFAHRNIVYKYNIVHGTFDINTVSRTTIIYTDNNGNKLRNHIGYYGTTNRCDEILKLEYKVDNLIANEVAHATDNYVTVRPRKSKLKDNIYN